MITHTHRVRYHETDAQGFLFNSRYLEIADVALTELFRCLGWSYGELNQAGVDPSVVQAHLTFARPARFDDDLEVEVKCKRVGRSSFDLAVAFTGPSGPCAHALMTYVNVDAAAAASRALPADVGDALRAATSDAAGEAVVQETGATSEQPV